MQRAWATMAAIAIGITSVGSSGCGWDQCKPGERRLDVHSGKGGFVCMPVDDPEPSSSSGPPDSDPPAAPLLPPPSATPTPTTVSPACGELTASAADIRVVVKDGTPAPLTLALPADGRYVLVQASAYPSSSDAFPIRRLGATLDVAGSTLHLAARADASAVLGPEESFTFALDPDADVLRKNCEGREGPVHDVLFPAPFFVDAPMVIGWDDGSRVLTLQLPTPYGPIELVFTE